MTRNWRGRDPTITMRTQSGEIVEVPRSILGHTFAKELRGIVKVKLRVKFKPVDQMEVGAFSIPVILNP